MPLPPQVLPLTFGSLTHLFERQIPTPETIAARQKLFASATRILDEMNKREIFSTSNFRFRKPKFV